MYLRAARKPVVLDVFVSKTKSCRLLIYQYVLLQSLCTVGVSLSSARGLWAIPELFVSTAFGTHAALFALAYFHGNKLVGAITHLCQISHSVSIRIIPLKISRQFKIAN